MATERYVCNVCNSVVEIDTRKKYKKCPYCGEDLTFCRLLGVQLVGKTLYNGSAYYSQEKLVLPEGTEEIEYAAFEGCGIKEVSLPSSLKEIPFNCFKDCRYLKKVFVPSSVQEIRPSAFEGCINLEEVVLSKGITEIKSLSFKNCTSLKKITIPDTVKIIGGFQGCTALEEIQFPAFVQSIDSFAFSE